MMQQIEEFYRLVCKRQQEAERRNQALRRDSRRAHTSAASTGSVDISRLETLKAQYQSEIAKLSLQMPAQVNTQQREPVYRAASFANLPSPHPSQCSSSPLPVLCSYRATSITPSLRPHGYTNTVTSSTNDKPTHLAAHTSAAAAAFFVSGNDPATQDGRVSICHLQSDSSTRSQLPQASTPLPKPFASSQDDGVDFKHQQQTTSPVQTSSTLPTYPPSASSSRLLPTLLAAAANYSVSWQPPNSLMTISPGSQSCQTTATPPPFTSLQVSREAAVPEQSHPILTTTVPAVATPNTTTHIPSSAIIATSLTATSTSVSTHAVSSTQTLVSTAPSAQLISDTCTVVTPPSYPEYPQLSPGASHPRNTGSSSCGTTHECSPPQQLGDRDVESPAETDPPPVLSQNRSSPCEHHQQSLLHDDDLPVSSLSHTPHCVQQPHNLTTVAGNDTIQLQSPLSNNPSQSVIVLSQEDSEPTLSLTPPLNHHTSDKDIDDRGTAAASSDSGGDPVEAPQPNPLAEHGTDPSSTDDYPRKLTEDAVVRGGGSLTDELKEGKGSSVSPHLPRDDISGGHILDMSSSSSKRDGHPLSLPDILVCDPTQNAGRDVGVVVRVGESVSELSEHSSSEDRHAAGVHRAESTTTEQITAQLRTESETDAYASFLQSVRRTSAAAPPLLDSDSEGIEDTVVAAQGRDWKGQSLSPAPSLPPHSSASSSSPLSAGGVVGDGDGMEGGVASTERQSLATVPSSWEEQGKEKDASLNLGAMSWEQASSIREKEQSRTQSKMLQKRLGFLGSESSLDSSDIEPPQMEEDDQEDFDFLM